MRSLRPPDMRGSGWGKEGEQCREIGKEREVVKRNNPQ